MAPFKLHLCDVHGAQSNAMPTKTVIRRSASRMQWPHQAGAVVYHTRWVTSIFSLEDQR